jgi:hypothetical protein
MSEPITDTQRIDFLADKDQAICNVTMPGEVVERNISSLRDAIDECIELDEMSKPEGGES